MVGRRAALATAIALLFLIPLASSTIVAEREAGGFDADGNWISSVEHDVHPNWWLYWSRDKDGNELDDRLEWLLEQPAEIQQDWWKRAPSGSARIFVDYNHHPTDADIAALEELGVEVTFRFTYLDTISATAPFESILDPDAIRSLPGVVMVEDLGLAEPNMHEAVPNMGVDAVWQDLGLDGTGSVIAILDTGVRGDHEGLNDMDDDHSLASMTPQILWTPIHNQFRQTVTLRSSHSTMQSLPTKNMTPQNHSILEHMVPMSLELQPVVVAARLTQPLD